MDWLVVERHEDRGAEGEYQEDLRQAAIDSDNESLPESVRSDEEDPPHRAVGVVIDDEEEEISPPPVAEILPPLLSKDDPRRMKLTREEYQWALDLKDHVESLPDLDNMTDFMYAQFAVFTKGNLEEAVNRAFGMQEFLQEFSILDSHEEGCRYLKFLMDTFPRQFLSFSFSDLEGTYVLAQDVACFDTTVLVTPDQMNDWLKASYYIHTAMSPDMATIRKGIIALLECEGVNWTQKQDYKNLQRMFSQLLQHHPIKGEMRHYHSGLIINLLTSMVKPFLCKETRDMIKMGLQLDGRLDQLFLVPDVATATARTLLRLQATLKRRYDNERSFKLHRGRA